MNTAVTQGALSIDMTEPLEQPDLQELLQQAATGREDAWRAIVEMYTPRVYGLLRAQCGNSDLAEEITQSTFCTVATKIDSYTESGRFEPWLFRIAMNRLRDEMRRRKRHATSVEHDTLTGLAGAAGDVRPSGASSASDEQRAEPSELQALREAMAQLSEADRQIIHLRHCGELSFKQIAEVLDQPLGTVLARQHRAFRRLQELMAPPEEDQE